MRLKTVLVSIAAAAIIIGVVIWWFVGKSELPIAEQIREKAPLYRFQVEKRSIPIQTTVVGNICPILSSAASSEISGQIKEVFVYEGDSFKEGDLLAKIDDEQYLFEFLQAKKQSESLIALFEQAKNQYLRTDRLLKKQASTQVEWEKAKANYESAMANALAAEENQQRLKTRFEKTNIYAPFDGFVGKKLVDEGDLALPGKKLFLIYSSGPFEINAEVPETFIPYLRFGENVDVSVDSFNLKTKGEITDIVPYGNPKSYTYTVKAILENNGLVLPLSFGRMTFPTGSHEAVLIPENAFERIGQLEIVKVFENGLWKRRYVRIGKRYENQVEVLSGLDEGETIGYD